MMLFRSRATAAAAVAREEFAQDRQVVSIEAMVAALDAVANCEDLSGLDGLPPILVDRIQALCKARGERDEQFLRQTVDYSMQASEAMAATARITGEIRDTDARAQGMAAGIEEMTASIDQIAGTARDVAQSMDSAHAAMQAGADATRSAAESSRTIGDSFGRMTGAADQLAEAAEQIGTFVATIDALAQQTNLLALNATIEAARAGEAGKGFAVVASEVKALSGQTQKATDDIRARIERLEVHVEEVMASVRDVQGLVDQSVERSENAEGEISQVLGIVRENTGRMNEIASVLSQQSEAVQEISGGVHGIAHHAHKAAGFADAAIRAVARSETIIAEQFADLETRTVPNYVLHRAKSDHLLWKKKLAEMFVGLNNLKQEELSDHHHCRLGKWYDAAAGQPVARHPSFAALLPVHEAVHAHGREAARLHGLGDRDGAAREIAEMDKASGEVLRHLNALIKAA